MLWCPYHKVSLLTLLANNKPTLTKLLTLSFYICIGDEEIIFKRLTPGCTLEEGLLHVVVPLVRYATAIPESFHQLLLDGLEARIPCEENKTKMSIHIPLKYS